MPEHIRGSKLAGLTHFELGFMNPVDPLSRLWVLKSDGFVRIWKDLGSVLFQPSWDGPACLHPRPRIDEPSSHGLTSRPDKNSKA